MPLTAATKIIWRSWERAALHQAAIKESNTLVVYDTEDLLCEITQRPRVSPEVGELQFHRADRVVDISHKSKTI